MKNKLSICIPTYNRLDKLKNTLNCLRKSRLSENIEIIISDNASQYDIMDLNSEYNDMNLKIYRNVINIGFNANFIRCFEYATGDWIWLLSDDDNPLETSISRILVDVNDISDDVCLIKYSSELGSVSESESIYGFDSLFRKITREKLFSNFLFMSTCVIKAEYVKQNFISLYNSAYCQFVHIWQPIYEVYFNNKSIYFSKEKICALKKDNKAHWFPGEVYCRILDGFNHYPFISKQQLRIIAKNWLNLNYINIHIYLYHFFEKKYREKEILYFYKNYIKFRYNLLEQVMFLVGTLITKYLIKNEYRFHFISKIYFFLKSKWRKV